MRFIFGRNLMRLVMKHEDLFLLLVFCVVHLRGPQAILNIWGLKSCYRIFCAAPTSKSEFAFFLKN